MVIYISLLNIITLNKKKKKKNYCASKAYVMSLVVLITGFPVWFSTFYLLKYPHTNS